MVWVIVASWRFDEKRATFSRKFSTSVPKVHIYTIVYKNEVEKARKKSNFTVHFVVKTRINWNYFRCTFARYPTCAHFGNVVKKRNGQLRYCWYSFFLFLLMGCGRRYFVSVIWVNPVISSNSRLLFSCTECFVLWVFFH